MTRPPTRVGRSCLRTHVGTCRRTRYTRRATGSTREWILPVYSTVEYINCCTPLPRIHLSDVKSFPFAFFCPSHLFFLLAPTLAGSLKLNAYLALKRESLDYFLSRFNFFLRKQYVCFLSLIAFRFFLIVRIYFFPYRTTLTDPLQFSHLFLCLLNRVYSESCRKQRTLLAVKFFHSIMFIDHIPVCYVHRRDAQRGG